MLQEFQHVYLIIDALDECTEIEVVLTCIEEMIARAISPLHLLVASRKEREIADCFGPQMWGWVDLKENVVDKDIAIHVRDSLQKDPKLKKWPKDMQEEILATLTNGAHGM
jgi:hypothetical protein